jgi:hypothetical protein
MLAQLTASNCGVLETSLESIEDVLGLASVPDSELAMAGWLDRGMDMAATPPSEQVAPGLEPCCSDGVARSDASRNDVAVGCHGGLAGFAAAGDGCGLEGSVGGHKHGCGLSEVLACNGFVDLLMGGDEGCGGGGCVGKIRGVDESDLIQHFDINSVLERVVVLLEMV